MLKAFTYFDGGTLGMLGNKSLQKALFRAVAMFNKGVQQGDLVLLDEGDPDFKLVFRVHIRP